MDSSHNLLRTLCRFTLYTDSFGLHNVFERYQLAIILLLYSSGHRAYIKRSATKTVSAARA
jgi:hypothetical protein